eukprot:TRINITY_DN7910_c0_g1_i2.p1 TRINITY_DN7910_c0_g1~~TRINITY_DN7910_c0_g1_i2.p1  ORF type:complete len:592 (+),score=160.36 TRINITY_DN7910_c0_g1_i2:90-1865(+)
MTAADSAADASSAGNAAVKAVIGEERFKQIQSAKLLVVGAGGIGCELLKNLVLTGFIDIEVVDLDTIDVSNLNRQFLFRRAHVDRPKSEVAAEAVRQFRPDAKIVAHHGNVKDAAFGVEFFSKFDVVVNALDNLEARRHVNRLCLAAEKPLLEAGSTGHLGQVTVIMKGQTECFECQAKPTQKVYPYCTIRSTPEKPVHCLTWAKNLFDLCFGPEDESNLLSDLATEMRQFQTQETVDGEDVGKRIYSHLFDADIRKQAELEDLWSEKRPPPTPLSFEEASQRTAAAGATDSDKDKLETQKVPTVSADAKGFVAAVATMYSERRSLIGQSVFSKDDQVSMDFVHCAANLRMENYRISRLSRWDAQSIAGSIIPAVASTNAIVSGLETVQLLHVLAAKDKPMRESRARTVWVRYPEPSRKKILQPSTLQKPNPDCFVCGARTARVAIKSLTECKIAAFAKACIQGQLGAHKPALYANGTCIFDPEYPEPGEEAEEEGLHPEWSLQEWGLTSGSLLQVEDEGQGFSCNLVVREEPELDEEKFPQGFKVESGAGMGEEVVKEEAEKKRKAEAEAAEAAAAKKVALDKDTVTLDD